MQHEDESGLGEEENTVFVAPVNGRLDNFEADSPSPKANPRKRKSKSRHSQTTSKLGKPFQPTTKRRKLSKKTEKRRRLADFKFSKPSAHLTVDDPAPFHKVSICIICVGLL
jgi:hypothetical protein